MEQIWYKTAKSILWAIVLQFVASFFMGLFGAIAAITAIGGALSSDSSGISALLAGAGALGIITILLGIVVLGAYVWYFFELCKFINLQTNKPDANAISMVRNAVIVSFIGTICGLIPVIGSVISIICAIAAAVMTLIGFSSYSKSAALPAIGLKGASQLKTYAILSIIAAIIVIIPLAGVFIGGILGIIGLVFLIMGWNNVAKGCPAPRVEGEPYL